MQKYTAIILTSRDIGEFDRMYLLYTREAGLIRSIGKGVRKQTAKLAGHLEPGTLSEVYIARAKGLGQITGSITVENFERVKTDFEKLSVALEVLHFFARKFAEEEKDERIFDLLADFLTRVGLLSESLTLAVEAFWWKLFDFLGNRPETMKCARCETNLQESGRNFFSAARGGILCAQCSADGKEVSEINSNQIKLLRIILANSLEKILKVKVDQRELGGLGRMRKDFERYNF
jgi:DNA repair protein RecO (recombination protein O)